MLNLKTNKMENLTVKQQADLIVKNNHNNPSRAKYVFGDIFDNLPNYGYDINYWRSVEKEVVSRIVVKPNLTKKVTVSMTEETKQKALDLSTLVLGTENISGYISYLINKAHLEAQK